MSPFNIGAVKERRREFCRKSKPNSTLQNQSILDYAYQNHNIKVIREYLRF